MIVELSDQARADLRAIGRYIASDDPDRAASFVEDLLNACLGLKSFPRRFPVDDRFGSDVRKSAHGEYLILYSISSIVEILAIVHGARDLDALFGPAGTDRPLTD